MKKMIFKRILRIILVLPLLANCAYPQQKIDKITLTVPKNKSQVQGSQSVIPKFEQLVEPSNYPYAQLQLIDLKGVKIEGLNNLSITNLSQNYFVNVSDSDYILMSDIYSKNRELKRSGFVTLDYIWHCYMGLRNSLSLTIINQYINYDLQNLLLATLKISVNDFKICQDVHVKADILENINFLKYALYLLDPDKYKDFGAKSNEVAKDIDFIPLGFYENSPKSRNTIKCLYYLSALELPLMDENDEANINNFRRCILLCRAISNAKMATESGLNVWKKIVQVQKFIFPSLNDSAANKIYPYEFSTKYLGESISSDEFLEKLADPLYRTQLLLSIRHEKPNIISSTSFKNLNSKPSEQSFRLNFRLLPNLVDPAYIYMDKIASDFKDSNNIFDISVLPLIYLHSLKALTANDLLLKSQANLSSNINKWIYFMDMCQSGYFVNNNSIQSKNTKYIDWRYNVISKLFQISKARTQIVLGSCGWATRSLESSFGMWLDSSLSVLSKLPNKELPKLNYNVISSTKYKIIYNYLEPADDSYLMMKNDLIKILEDLPKIGYFPNDYSKDLNNFKLILEKLDKISQLEIKNEKVPLTDLLFLGYIDLYLKDYDVQLVNFESLKLNSQKYLNLSLGQPGYLNIILEGLGRATLSRGALYDTYIEIGNKLTLEHLQRQLLYNTIRQPLWLNSYDVVQKDQKSN